MRLEECPYCGTDIESELHQRCFEGELNTGDVVDCPKCSKPIEVQVDCRPEVWCFKAEQKDTPPSVKSGGAK